MDILLAFLGWFFGSLFTVLFTIWLETQRRPNLKISIGEVCDFPGGFLGRSSNSKWRSLRLSVTNDASSLLKGLMPRSPAQMCQARIQIICQDGTMVGKAIVARWAGTPEPQVTRLLDPNGKPVPVLLNGGEVRSTIDIMAGGTEVLDVAVRVDGEDEAYIWNNQTYFIPDWRNKDAAFDRRIFLLWVTVTSAGIESGILVRLENDGSFSNFRLTSPTNSERAAAQSSISGDLGMIYAR